VHGAKRSVRIPNLILLTQAEKWNGTLPAMIVPGQTVPFIDVAGEKP
jgi:hypothetical protein